MKDIRYKSGFISLLGLIIAAAIICYLCFVALQSYFKSPRLEKAIDEVQPTQKSGASSYRSILQNSKIAVDEYNRRIMEQEKQLEEFSEK